MRKLTKAERELIADYNRDKGRRGAMARAKKLTAAERSAIARKAALARWGKSPTPHEDEA